MAEEYYDGYRFSDEFVQEVFRLYTPDTKVGSTLFSYERFVFPGSEPKEEWKGTYTLVDEKRDRIEGTEYYNLYTTAYLDGKTWRDTAKKSGYVTKDDKKIYFPSSHEYSWRNSKEVIALAKQKGLFNKDGKESERRPTSLSLAKVPIGYGYSIREYDGMESVSIKPDTISVLTELLAYIDSQDESKLGPMSQKLVKKSMNVHDFLYPRIADD